MEEILVKEKVDKWDCESVLSTYPYLYNHPKIISDQIRLSTKISILKDVLGRGLTGALKRLDMEAVVLEDDDVLSGLRCQSSPSDPSMRHLRRRRRGGRRRRPTAWDSRAR